jgi:long-chain acyl-CoA synthetase
LIALGVQPGDRIALHLPNLPQFILCFYGALKAGAAVVPVNPLYTVRELARVLTNAEPRVVVTLSRLERRVREALADRGEVSVVVTKAYDYLPWLWRWIARLRMREHGERGAGLGLAPLLRRASPRAPNVHVEPDHLAVLQYTGGTTGIPKGAMLSHRNLVANCTQMRHWLSDMRDGEERFLAVVPFFHVSGPR